MTLSPQLLNILEKLNDGKTLDILQNLDYATYTDLHLLHGRLPDISYQSLASRIRALEKIQLVEVELASDARTQKGARLTEFSAALMRSLLDCQKLLEERK
jgi:DNA-binding HxlR family transcriptional regulator